MLDAYPHRYRDIHEKLLRDPQEDVSFSNNVVEHPALCSSQLRPQACLYGIVAHRHRVSYRYVLSLHHPHNHRSSPLHIAGTEYSVGDSHSLRETGTLVSTGRG